jgi:pimeloyl-ACP methyl ester carboxylesterase
MTAGLHYEIRGTGTPLLLIPGGNGDAGFYEPFAKALAREFTVISYDRRGFSRSPIEGSVDDDHRLQADVDDARGMLESLADGPAHVFGSSSGGIVALELLTRYPDVVHTLIAHEPPMVTLLPDGDRYLELFNEIHDTYRRKGTRAAMRKFSSAAHAGVPRPASLEFWRMLKLMPRIRRNVRFWLEHELRQYTRYQPNIAALQKLSAKLVLAGGRDSSDYFPSRPNVALAEALGIKVLDLPGGHAGYRTHATEFARELTAVLRGAR